MARDEIEITLDHAGVEQYLKSAAVAAFIEGQARRVAANVSVRKGDVVVDTYTTDRAAASVTHRHPAARFYQARDGTLTRAAAAVGLEVTAR